MEKGNVVFTEGTKWLVGKDSRLYFWFDKWLDKGPLRSLIEGPLNKGEDQILLRDIIGFNGCRCNNISFSFPNPLTLEIKATPIPVSNSGTDHMTWISYLSGKFELKKAHKLATCEDINY